MRTYIVVLCLMLVAGPASAHAFLEHADPGAGAELKDAPKQITLAFTKKIEPSSSGVAVTDAEGHDVEAEPAVVSGAAMTVMLKPLTQGSYHVVWHVVSEDSHRTDGSYNFQVTAAAE